MRVPAAIAISVAKASLVVVFFMELVRQRPTNRFVVIAAMLMVFTLTGLMVVDVLTRDTPPMLPATSEQTR
jgi:caa(3)-type oxidase subunit IV